VRCKTFQLSVTEVMASGFDINGRTNGAGNWIFPSSSRRL